MFPVIDEHEVIQLSIIFLGIQVIQTTLESLANHRIYRKDQLLSWDLLRYAKPFFHSNIWITKALDVLFRYPTVLLLFVLRLLFAGGMVFLSWKGIESRLLTILILGTSGLGILLGWRNIFSNNGSDQLTTIILIPVCIYTTFAADPLVRIMSIYFIACQSELSYLTSGFFKLAHKNWRNGNTLKEVLSTSVWGNRCVKSRLDKHPMLYKYGSYAVIGGEILLGCSFIFPPYICICLLAAGVLFHLMVAIVMGLNTFFWAFLSTYSAVYYVCLIHHQAAAI